MIGRGGPYLSALAQCELEGFGWTWSSSEVSDCAFPISLNVFGIVAVVLDSLKLRHHGKVPYPRQGNAMNKNINCGIIMEDISDHFPIFCISELDVKKPLKNNNELIYRENTNDNIKKHKNFLT